MRKGGGWLKTLEKLVGSKYITPSSLFVNNDSLLKMITYFNGVLL
jgi:hypothetical protein